MGMLMRVGPLSWTSDSTVLWYYQDGQTKYAEGRRLGPKPDDPEERFRIGGPLVTESTEFASLEEAKRAVEELEATERATDRS
jgi:hypothetical protein